MNQILVGYNGILEHSGQPSTFHARQLMVEQWTSFQKQLHTPVSPSTHTSFY